MLQWRASYNTHNCNTKQTTEQQPIPFLLLYLIKWKLLTAPPPPPPPPPHTIDPCRTHVLCIYNRWTRICVLFLRACFIFPLWRKILGLSHCSLQYNDDCFHRASAEQRQRQQQQQQKERLRNSCTSCYATSHQYCSCCCCSSSLFL